MRKPPPVPLVTPDVSSTLAVVDSASPVDKKTQITAAGILILQVITALLDGPSRAHDLVIGVTRIQIPALSMRGKGLESWALSAAALLALLGDVRDAGQYVGVDLIRADNAYSDAIKSFMREHGYGAAAGEIEGIAYSLRRAEAGLTAWIDVARAHNSDAAAKIWREKAEAEAEAEEREIWNRR